MDDEAGIYDQFSVVYYYDEDSALSIEEIAGYSFTRQISNQFALGYRDGTAWFRITVRNSGEQERYVLYFTEAFWSSLDLYENINGDWLVRRNGLDVPIKDRGIHSANPAFALKIPANETSVFYIRGSSVSSQIGEFKLFTEEAFFKSNHISITETYIFYSGILFFVMLFVGFLYFSMHEAVYIYYVGYVASFIAWVSVQSGYYLYTGIPGWDDALHALGTLLVFFLAIFSRVLLNLKQNAPVINKLFELSAVLFLGCGIAISLNIPSANPFFNLTSSLFFALLLATAVLALVKGFFFNARYYLIAIVIYMATMGLMTLTYIGLLPNTDLTRYSFLFGSFAEIMFFTFILVTRYQYINRERVRVTQEMMRDKEKYMKQLEQAVDERTRDLARANEELISKTSELEEAKQQLIYDATTDLLSGLSNRRYLLERFTALFSEAKKEQRSLSLIMIDIDHFKTINDTYGHEAGDDAIKLCAVILKSYARSIDIVSRYGGEEFAILMPHTSLGEASFLAEDIRRKIEGHNIQTRNSFSISLTLSLGVTQIKLEQDEKIDDVLSRADRALYTAKREGRNRVISL